MYDRFGEFDSAEELNETAVNLRKEGDREGLEALARENGIDGETLGLFLTGDLLYLCDGMSAAIGKIEVEAEDAGCEEIMADWVEYIKQQCFEKPQMAEAVRRKGKSLKGCIAELLKWGFGHQKPVDSGIMKAAGVTAGRCTLGIPGMARAKWIITQYYIGGDGR